MKFKIIATIFLTWTLCSITACNIRSIRGTQEDAEKYLTELEPKYSEACNKQVQARWDYITNITPETEKKSVEETNKFAAFQAGIQKELLEKFPDWKLLNNESIRREIKFLSITGPSNMSEKHVSKMNQIQTDMESAYAKAKVCDYKNRSKCDLSLEPEIEDKLINVKDYDELVYYWTAWHDTMGSAITPSEYAEFVSLENEMAKANGFSDTSSLGLQQYDDGTPGWTVAKFKEDMESIWLSLKPFYQKLHTWVGKKLRLDPEYGPKIQAGGFGANLPAHLFRNMWAQQWGEMGNSTKPYPNAGSVDVTGALIKKGYTEKKIFEVADEFFGNLGLQRMTPKFWEKSMLIKPKDRDVVCHASAEDMCLGKGSQNFRIKMCTKVTEDDLVTAHHEMGHIEYFMQYTNQRFIFRNGANPGFHEALGDALALSVITPKHLQCQLGLELGVESDCSGTSSSNTTGTPTPTDINFLYLMALNKVAFLPFGYSVDKWRWEVEEGKIQPKDYSRRWWEIKAEIQGIVPPAPRTNASMFDPAAKYHIPANVEYIRYFISHILQFQFYEAMCIAAGEFDPGNQSSKPLYQCDFSGHKEAGGKLAKMLEVGFLHPWPEALEILTGSRELSTSSLITYFTPLFNELDKLLEQNSASGSAETA